MSRLQTTPSGRRRAGDSDTIVFAQGLTKVFKDFWLRDRARAVEGIDFQIDRGEVFGLLGPNGSGKSTTIKMILGLLKKTSGRLIVFDKPPFDVAVKKRIGYLPEESYLYPFLNARETLDYYARLFQLDHKVRERRIDELLDMVGLTGVQYRQVREYSKGMQRRIGIAQALINDPEFLILDEPTTGLDPLGTRQVKDLIIELGRRGKTILLSSHLLSDVEDVVSRMVILYGGKIRSEGTCDDLLEARERSIIETDRLDDETLAEIQQVLARRNHDPAIVSHPRQKLEELFVGIVESAQADRLSTSGASSGGATADFLKGDEAEGESLIDSLVSAPAGGDRPAQTAPRPQAPREEDVIEGLLDEEGDEPAGRPDEPAPAHDDGPDDDLIADLLGDDDGGDDDKPTGGTR